MAYTEYLKNHMEKKTQLKVFLDNKTMLQGLVLDFDKDSIVLDKCLILKEHIISVTPL